MRSEQERLERVRGLLQEALPGADEILAPVAGGGSFDLRFRFQGADLSVIVAAAAPRIVEVEGRLARAALMFQRNAARPREVPIIVVVLRGFGGRLEKAVRTFMGEYAPRVGWGLADEEDRAVLEIPALGVSWKRSAPRFFMGRSLWDRRDRQLFTDLNRWMLKILLLLQAPEDAWGGPRRRPRHPTELAGIARVSVAKAHRFAIAFQEEGFLRKTGDGLKLVRIRALLEAWLQDETNGSPRSIPVRSLVPAAPSLFAEARSTADPPLPPEAWKDSALGGALAALHRGLFRGGSRQPPIVHIGIPMARALREWQLEECDPRDAEMTLRRPLHPRSVFRGIVRRKDGAPLVDIWQTALDCVSDSVRGREQADFILERVLALQEGG